MCADQRINSTSYNAGPGVHAGERDRNVKFWPGTKKCGYTDSAKQNLIAKQGSVKAPGMEFSPASLQKDVSKGFFFKLRLS